MTQQNAISIAAGTTNLAFSRIRSATSGPLGLIMPDLVLEHIEMARAALNELESAARGEAERRVRETKKQEDERSSIDPALKAKQDEELYRRRLAQENLENVHHQTIAQHNARRHSWWRKAS